MSTFEMTGAASAMATVVRGVRDDQLGGPTPCPAYRVGDLAEHVGGLTVAFVHAARKTDLPGEAGPGDAWTGTTMAGPVEMPAPAAALVVLDELVVHAWDLAVATGQPYAPDPLDVAACQSFVDQFDPPEADGGLFGPPVPVAPDASPLDRLLGRTGRDPAWRPA
jgi:hypothetical protein